MSNKIENTAVIRFGTTHQDACTTTHASAIWGGRLQLLLLYTVVHMLRGCVSETNGQPILVHGRARRTLTMVSGGPRRATCTAPMHHHP
jgi:hypothetical protein